MTTTKEGTYGYNTSQNSKSSSAPPAPPIIEPPKPNIAFIAAVGADALSAVNSWNRNNLADGGLGDAPENMALRSLGNLLGAGIRALLGLFAENPTATTPKVSANTRPNGVPTTWESKPSDNGGTIWFDPKNPSGNWVRVEPGKPSSPNPWQQNPYVKMFKDGKQVDVNGKPIPRPVRADGTLGKSGDTEAAHIPLEDFNGI